MKKVVFLFLAIVLALVGFVRPVSAASKLQIKIASPATAEAGQVIEVSIGVENKNNKKERIGWVVSFPKTVVASVEILGDRKFEIKEKTDNWSINWLDTIPARSSTKLVMRVKLQENYVGKAVLISVGDHSKVLETKKIKVVGLQKPTATFIPTLTATSTPTILPTVTPTFTITPEPTFTAVPMDIQWSVSSPSEVIYGQRPFVVEIVITNPSTTDMVFDYNLTMYQGSTGGTNGSAQISCDVGLCGMYSGGNWSSDSRWWGTIFAGQTNRLVFETASAVYAGVKPLYKLVDNTTGEMLNEASISLVLGTSEPYAAITLVSPDGSGQLILNQSSNLVFELFAPTLSQFTIDSVTSTCPIVNLPIGAVSNNNLTYARFTYNVIPVEVVGECRIDIAYHLRASGVYKGPFTAQVSFIVQ